MELVFANKAERTRSLPGDQLVAKPLINTTHAITIDTAPEYVWPWIVQMGQSRGGFYSYTFLENLLGCQMKNAEQINADWQQLEIGDSISIHPSFQPLSVEDIDTNKYLVLGQQLTFKWSWTFSLFDAGDNRCRLLVRTRVSRFGLVASLVLYPIMTFGHYVMERRMLIGIKRRCER